MNRLRAPARSPSVGPSQPGRPRRAGRPPRPVVACWALSVAVGAAAISVQSASATTVRRSPFAFGELAPSTLASHLAGAAGLGARDIRVAGLAGSGHDGSWTFAAYLTWTARDGTLQSGITALPFPGGSSPPTHPLTSVQLADVQRHGLTLRQLQDALPVGGPADAALLGLVRIDPPLTGPTLVECAGQTSTGAIADRGEVSGTCRRHTPGAPPLAFTGALDYDHQGGSLQVSLRPVS